MVRLIAVNVHIKKYLIDRTLSPISKFYSAVSRKTSDNILSQDLSKMKELLYFTYHFNYIGEVE